MNPKGILLFAFVVPAACLSGQASATVPTWSVRVVRSYPHDTGAFTEGLVYNNGFLYESTGLEGHSSIRKVELKTGRVLREHELPGIYFGEGIVPWKDRLIQVTWRTGIGFVYDLSSFRLRSSFHYPGEGWALTSDATRLIMSDGTSNIRFLDPDTLRETGHVTVTANGKPVLNINELEWVKGRLYANIWMTNTIAVIDPKSGHVIAWVDVAPLAAMVGERGDDAVPNGIAYDPAGDRLFVTGKLWPTLFEIRLVSSSGQIRP